MREAHYSIPGVPKIALLSDLHNRPFQDSYISLKGHRPEIICITGDVVYGKRPMGEKSLFQEQENVLPFLRACNGLAPSFLSLGNHERILEGEELEILRSTGVTLLDDAWVKRGSLVIGGLTSGHVIDYRRYIEWLRLEGEKDPWERAYKRDREKRGKAHRKRELFGGYYPNVDWLPSFAGQEGIKILLCHHPEYYPLIPREIQLILSGHAHGGQLRLFSQGLYATGQGFLPRWTRGVYEGRMVVSAGLSNTVSIPRLFNPREVVYINL